MYGVLHWHRYNLRYHPDELRRLLDAARHTHESDAQGVKH
jgi:hypothetical protein